MKRAALEFAWFTVTAIAPSLIVWAITRKPKP